MNEGRQDRMFINENSVVSVDRGVKSTGHLFIARRPDSPYLVPGVDREYVATDIADEHERQRNMCLAALYHVRAFCLRHPDQCVDDAIAACESYQLIATPPPVAGS